MERDKWPRTREALEAYASAARIYWAMGAADKARASERYTENLERQRWSGERCFVRAVWDTIEDHLT